MRKDKAWLIQKVSDIFWRVEIDDDFNIQNANIMFDDISNLIDQLDEPETLLQEWIDENKVARINDVRKMTTSDVVPVEKLKNLLVPKQDNGFVVFEKDKLDEEVQRMIDKTYKEMNEKPVIPKFVADWIDAHNLYGNNPLREYRDLEIDFNEGWTDEKDASVYHWVNENPYAFIDALRYGCEVEEEPLYTIKLPQTDGVFARYSGQGFQGWEIMDEYVIIGRGDWKYKFTEAEIKAIDERHWAFAEEVTPCN